MKKAASSGKQRKTTAQKVARLYHFEPQTVQQIDFLSRVFGGKEKEIAAAVALAATLLRGEQAEFRLAIK